MGTVGHRRVLPLLALLLVPSAFSVPAPNLIQTNETPSFLTATDTPIEPLSQPVTRLSAFPFRLTTYITYPACDCSPYTQKPDRFRRAISLRDRWGPGGRWVPVSTSCRFVPDVAMGIQT